MAAGVRFVCLGPAESPVATVCWHPAPAATPDVNRTGFITCAPRPTPAAPTGDESASAGKDHGRTRAQLRVFVGEVRRHRSRHVERSRLRDRAASGFTRRHARLETRWSEGVPAHPGSGARSGPAGRRGVARRTRAHRRTDRRRPPRGARRIEVLRLDCHHAGGHRQGRRVHPPRAAAQPSEPGRHPPRAGTVSVAAAGRGVRHGVPSDDAAGGIHVPGALRVARGAQRAPLRLPRHQPPLCREASPATDGTVAGAPPAGDRPPRQRVLVRGGQRRPQCRHDDGPHAARGRHDGHAQRVGRPGDHRPHQRRARQARRSDPGRAEQEVGAARRLGPLERHADD